MNIKGKSHKGRKYNYEALQNDRKSQEEKISAQKGSIFVLRFQQDMFIQVYLGQK